MVPVAVVMGVVKPIDIICILTHQAQTMARPLALIAGGAIEEGGSCAVSPEGVNGISAADKVNTIST
jgi:hypothetical protein